MIKKKMNGNGLVYADWRKALLVLEDGDDVDRLAMIVHAYHIHARDERGTTLLHVAYYHGRMSSAGWLLESGAEKEARDDWGQTPLHIAAANWRAGCVAVLLRHGARVDPMSKDGWTPLADAVLRGHQQTARLLLDAGASIELAQKKTRIPPWADAFLRGREACAKAAKIFIGISDRQHRDVVRLIGELIWNTRGAEVWDDASTRTKRAK